MERGARGRSGGSSRKRGGGHATKAGGASSREEVEIVQLEKRISAALPELGSVGTEFTEFAQLPLSRYTLTGLQRGKFAVMTQIQRGALLHALGGRDVLGAAKTGSGKTLAFVIPVLESLYRARWTGADGVGALIISPTRELAMQIFEVLKIVGAAQFSLSAGLVTGGKDFAEEAAAIGRMAVLVATPGRLLQHLEQTADFDASSVRILVLDEADRLLDLGFSETLNSILSYIPAPPARQTLLFSATQTKSVRDLARLSLRDPQYIAVHEKAESATPSRLTQHYVVCKLEDKLNMLFSFLRSHLHSKCIIFVSSCKEARFLFESFRRLRPGVPLQLLHGKMKQTRRMLVFYDFLKKDSAALFATDVAARGLDFTGVDWVLQLDCPEDTNSYIHRAGRTARFTAKGHALTVLTPTEATGFVPLLTAARVPISEIRINASSAISVTGKLAAEIAADPVLKQLAQRAFCSYVRSVALQRNKDVFKVVDLPLDAYAESMGLAATPPVKLARFLGGNESDEEGVSLADADALTPAQADVLRHDAHARKNSNKALARLKDKISAEKAVRKAAKAAAAAGVGKAKSRREEDDEDGSSEEDDDAVLGDSDEDCSEGEEEEEVVVEPRRKSKGKIIEEDELLVLKPPSGDDGALVPPSSLRAAPADLAALSERERSRVLRIERETRDMAVDIESGGVGTDGMTPFQRIAEAKRREVGASAAPVAPAPLQSALAANAARLAARLSASATVDREAERVRVKEKHRRERMEAKGRVVADDDAEEEEEQGDDGGGVRLAGASGSESGSSSKSNSSEEEEEAPAPQAGRKRAREALAILAVDVADMEAAALAKMEAKKHAKHY